MKITIKKNEITKNRNCSKKRKNVSYHFLENPNIYVVLREHYGKKDNNPSCTDIFFRFLLFDCGVGVSYWRKPT